MFDELGTAQATFTASFGFAGDLVRERDDEMAVQGGREACDRVDPVPGAATLLHAGDDRLGGPHSLGELSPAQAGLGAQVIDEQAERLVVLGLDARSLVPVGTSARRGSFDGWFSTGTSAQALEEAVQGAGDLTLGNIGLVGGGDRRDRCVAHAH